MTIDTLRFSASLREKSIDVAGRKLLVTNFRGSEQEPDLSEPANCKGYGRIRHFRRAASPGWPENPLPIDPAAYKLALPREDIVRAQVFQNASCNWRCWYCYVPFNLLSANKNQSGWLSASDLLDLYEREPSRPCVIDLSGGQPDLTPEWVPWMMRELRERKLDAQTYLWSDDNLSNDYFWRYLSRDDIELICSYENYGKVCCFKGFNAESFTFNTGAAPELFNQQLALFRRYLDLGIDVYGYATFTTPTDHGIPEQMSKFVDKLQMISPNLPLRVVPLEIQAFSPVHARLQDEHRRAMRLQWKAIEFWKIALQERFSSDQRALAIYDVAL